MTPISALQHQVQTRPDHTAFISGEQAWTYRRLAAEAGHLAQALQARGVQQGDRVALHMMNVPELAVAYYACFYLGAIAAPLNIRLKAAELRPLLRRLQPVLYLGHTLLYAEVEGIEPDILALDARFTVGGAVGGNRAQAWASLVSAPADRPAPGGLPDWSAPDADLPAILLATSGTTGQPKFVVHTPATLSGSDMQAPLDADNQHLVVNPLPMVHASGINSFLTYVRAGVPMVLLERFDPDAVLDAVEARRCSTVPALPFMFASLLKQQRARKRDVGSLRHCATAGDVCPADLQREFAEQFGIPLRSFWSSTEAVSAFTYGLQPGPVARILPGTQARLVDDAGASVPHGEAGELLLRGPGVSVGYWAGPGRIEGALQGGWIATGDLMRQGDGDDFWFVGRKKDLIVRGASKISPVEVEQVLMAHPAVQDAAVIGVPDAELGQRVAALVQLKGEETEAILSDIRASAIVQLADYKVPEHVTAVDAIPKNAAGKTDRKSLPTSV